MQKRGGSGPAAVLIQKINRGAAFRTGFYWIVLGLEENPIRNVAKKIQSETSPRLSSSLSGTVTRAHFCLLRSPFFSSLARARTLLS